MIPSTAGRFLVFLTIITGCLAATNSTCAIGKSDAFKNRASCAGKCETFEEQCDYTRDTECEPLLESLKTCKGAADAFLACIDLQGTVFVKGADGLFALAIYLKSQINSCEIDAYYEANPKCTSDADCPAGHHCDPGPGDCPANPGCFAALSTVQLEDGTTKRMDQLQLRDRVHVGNGVFSDVYYFSTLSTEEEATFLHISTQHGNTIMVTPGHFLLSSAGALMTASKVVVGTSLRLGDGTATLVTAVANTQAQGLYNPHTLSGEIVVDGVLASSFTEALPPTVARALLAPLKMLHHLHINFGQGLRGVSKRLHAGIVAGLDKGLIQSASSLARKVY